MPSCSARLGIRQDRTHRRPICPLNPHMKIKPVNAAFGQKIEIGAAFGRFDVKDPLVEISGPFPSRFPHSHAATTGLPGMPRFSGQCLTFEFRTDLAMIRVSGAARAVSDGRKDGEGSRKARTCVVRKRKGKASAKANTRGRAVKDTLFSDGTISLAFRLGSSILTWLGGATAYVPGEVLSFYTVFPSICQVRGVLRTPVYLSE